VIADELERATMAYLVARLVASTAGAAAGGALADGGLTSVDTIPAALSTPMGDGGIGELSDENGIPLAGGNIFRLYRGHGTEERQLPCAVVSVQGGGDNGDLSGNEAVKLQVDILLPASPVDAGTIAGLAALLATCRAAITAAEDAQDIPVGGTNFAALLAAAGSQINTALAAGDLPPAAGTAAIVDIPAALRSASATLIDALQADDLAAQLNAVRFDVTRLTVIGVTDRASDHSAEGRARVHTLTIGLYCAGCDVS